MGKKSKLAKASLPRLDRRSAKPHQEERNLSKDFWWLLPALVLGVLVYLNTVNGEFIYDDLRQIVRNTLIQDGSKFWQALSSDVWAFKGGEEAVSSYWRPSFVLWMILNFRCFGLNVVGWHCTNILLHVAVIALAFALLRRLNVSRPVAGAIALLFAVHPVHTESVAWIAGAPDLILGAALIGSIWFVELLCEKKTPMRWTLAIVLYLVALGAKEAAILYPLIVVAIVYRRDSHSGRAPSWGQIFSIAWPFAAVGVLYLVARLAVVGLIGRSVEGGAGAIGTILTAPAAFTFYVRQLVFPYWIGPSYPLRVVTPANIGLSNFVLPLLITVASIWLMTSLARSRVARIGLGIFIITLLPAMNIGAFQPEQLVHDRYLYVPSLGFLILLVPALGALLERVATERVKFGAQIIFVLSLVFAVPLSAQTIRYNRAWTSNLALWEWGVRSDPTSAFNYQQYGVHLNQAKRADEAVAAFNRSIEIHPLASTYTSRATALIDQSRFPEAEHDLHEVISKDVKQVTAYTMYQAYERLAISAQQQRKWDQAKSAITEGRSRMPQYSAALTEKLAVILYQSGERQRALEELNAVQIQGRTEPLPESRLIFFRLGLLNEELGHPQDARVAFQEFLSLTQNMLTPDINAARVQAKAALEKLNR